MRRHVADGRRRPTARTGITLTAATIVGALIATMAVVPAQAAVPDVAEAEASLLSGGGIVDVDAIAALAGAYSATGPSNGLGTSRNDLDLTALRALGVDLGNGVRLIGDNGILQLGVAGQYATSSSAGATASSGLIGGDGAIAVGSGAPGAGASLDLNPLLSSVPATTGVVTDVKLGLGALSSQISQQRTASGATLNTAYQVAGARYTLTSPAVSNLNGTLQTSVRGLSTSVNALAGQAGAFDTATNGVITPLQNALRSLAGLGVVTLDSTAVTASVNVDLDAALATVLAQPVSSGPVTITPKTGQIVIDLGALNDLPANTDLLNATVIARITTGVEDILTNQLPARLLTAINTAVDTTAVTVTLTTGVRVSALVRDTLTATATTTLGNLLGTLPSTPTVVVTGTGVVGALGATLLGGVVAPVVTGTLLPLVGNVYRPLLSSTAGQTNISTSLTTVTRVAVTALAPLTTVLNALTRVTVNAQDATTGFRDARGLDTGARSVHAISLTVLPAARALRVDLATSTVRAAAYAPLAITTPTEGQQFSVPSVGATRTVTVTGTGEPGAAVSVSLGSGPTGTATVAANGTWSAPVAAVPAGTFTATVTQAVGGTVIGTATRGFVVVAQAPLVITAPTAGFTYTVVDRNATTPVTVSGTATQGARVDVVLSDGRTATTTASTDAGGTWSVPFPGTPVASYVASATQTTFGDTSEAVTRAFSVQAGAGLTIDSPTPNTGYRVPDAASTVDIPLTGRANPNATVTVTIGAQTATTTATSTGTWSATVPTVPVGAFTATAVQTVAGADSAPMGVPLAVTAATGVEISTPASGTTLIVADTTSTRSVTVSGTAEPNAPVRVDLGGGRVATTTADGQGAWSVPVTAVPVGTTTISVTQTVAGIVSTPVTRPVTVAAGAPVVLTTPAVGDQYRVASPDSTATVTVSGTAQAGASVAVDLGGGRGGTVTASGDPGTVGPGNWRLDVPDVPVGGYAASATQTVGGTTQTAASHTFGIVAGAPVSVSSPTPGAIVPVAGAGDTATIVVTGTAEANADVTVDLGSGLTTTTTADPAGAWSASLPGVPVGTRTLGATQTVGGTTSAPVTQQLTVAVGAALAVTAPGDGTSFVVTPGGGTTGVVVSGTGQAGATVTTSLGGALTAQTVVPASGQWSATVAGVPAASYTLTTTQAVNGSTSTPDTRAVSVVEGGPVVITSPPTGTRYLVAGRGDVSDVPVSGTGVAGAAVTVTLAGRSNPVTVAPDGTWNTVFAAVPVGSYQAGARQDQGGVLTDAVPIRVVVADGDPVVIATPTSGQTITVVGDAVTTTTVPVTGTAQPGASVVVTIGSLVSAAVVAGPDGAWATTVAGVGVGPQTATAVQTVNGTTSSTLGRPFTVVTGAAITLATPDAGQVYTVADPSSVQDVVVSGTAQPGAVVTVVLDGADVGTVTAAADTGAWRWTLAGVAVGAHETGASQSLGDTRQTSESRVFTIAPAAPLTIEAPADGVPIVLGDPLGTTTVTVRGQAEPGASVRIDLGGDAVATVTADPAGLYAATVGDLPIGTREIVVTQTVGTGSTSAPVRQSLVIAAARQLTIDRPAPGTVVEVADAASRVPVTVTGTAEPGATVTVALAAAAGAPPATTVPTDATGAWSAEFVGVGPGDYGIRATQSVGGSTSPVVGRPLSIRAVRAVDVTEPADGSTITVAAPSSTVSVPVTGTAAPGATVRVGLNGAAPVETVADPSSGDWSVPFPGLATGAYSVSVVQIVGATTSTPTVVGFTIAAAAAVTIDEPATGTRIRVPGSAPTTPVTVVGRADPDATVRVDLGDDLVRTVRPDGTGRYEATFDAVPAGDRVVGVTQSIGGTTSPVVERPFAVVVLAPPTVAAPTPGQDFAADGSGVAPVVVRGAAESGAVVGVSVDGAPPRTVTADASGAWSLTVPLAPGEHTVSATQTAGGATSDPVDVPVSVQPAPAQPAAPVRVTYPAPGQTITDTDGDGVVGLTVTGTGQPGATVTVDLGGGRTGTTTVGGDGTWSVPVTGVPLGERTVVVEQSVGGVVVGSTTITVTVAPAGTVAPLRITTPAAGSVTPGGPQGVADVPAAGTGQPGAALAVSVDGRPPVQLVVGADGTWSTTLVGLASGGHVLSATQTVNGSTTAPETVAFRVAAAVPNGVLEITSPTEGQLIDDEGELAVEGVGTPGATVVVTLSSGASATGVVGGDGIWRVLFRSLVAGPYTATARMTVGTVVTSDSVRVVLVDDLAPLVIGSPQAGTVFRADADGTVAITVSGTSEPGADVAVTLDPGAAGGPASQTVTSDPATGAWTATWTGVGIGRHVVAATQTVAGATSLPVTTGFSVVAAAAGPGTPGLPGAPGLPGLPGLPGAPGAPGAGLTPGGAVSAGTAAHGLAYTGSDAFGLGGLAALVLLLGLAFVATGRARVALRSRRR